MGLVHISVFGGRGMGLENSRCPDAFALPSSAAARCAPRGCGWLGLATPMDDSVREVPSRESVSAHVRGQPATARRGTVSPLPPPHQSGQLMCYKTGQFYLLLTPPGRRHRTVDANLTRPPPGSTRSRTAGPSPFRWEKSSDGIRTGIRHRRVRARPVPIRSGPPRDDFDPLGRFARDADASGPAVPIARCVRRPGRRDQRLGQSLSPFSPRPIARSPERTTSMIALRSSALMKASSLAPSPVTSMM